MIMEATITQNSGLYLAQHITKEERRAFFRRMRVIARNQPAARTSRIIGSSLPRRSRDNGK